MGLQPAATFLTVSVKMARAKTVAVVVPSPATSLVLEATSWSRRAPRFSNLSFRTTAFATVTPSVTIESATARRQYRPRGSHWVDAVCMFTLGDLRAAVGGLDQHVTSLGAEGDGDSPREGINTVQKSLSSLNTKLQFLRAGDATVSHHNQPHPCARVGPAMTYATAELAAEIAVEMSSIPCGHIHEPGCRKAG